MQRSRSQPKANIPPDQNLWRVIQPEEKGSSIPFHPPCAEGMDEKSLTKETSSALHAKLPGYQCWNVIPYHNFEFKKTLEKDKLHNMHVYMWI